MLKFVYSILMVFIFLHSFGQKNIFKTDSTIWPNNVRYGYWLLFNNSAKIRLLDQSISNYELSYERRITPPFALGAAVAINFLPYNKVVDKFQSALFYIRRYSEGKSKFFIEGNLAMVNQYKVSLYQVSPGVWENRLNQFNVCVGFGLGVNFYISKKIRLEYLISYEYSYLLEPNFSYFRNGINLCYEWK